ncbi:M4 family metallopeptidase [Dokdonia sp.]|uniref:M4 family metallopeptidase n=1 Tax=Dokdonia sp. TaxID=2024995 RepID=UPI0032631ACD
MKQILQLICLCVCTISFAQKTTNFGNIPLTKVKENFKKSTDQSIFFSELKPTSGVEFRLIKTETDKLGMIHRTYQQYYNGIKVHFGVLKVHEKNGVRKNFSGAYFNPSGLRTSTNMSSFQVQSIAKQFMRSNDVFWLDSEGISKSNAPNPELLILPNRRTATLHVAYAIGVGVSTPSLKMGILYVDAQTGAVLKFKNQVFTCFENKESGHDENHSNNKNKYTTPVVSGTGATVYSGSQSIETTLDGSDYILYDQTRANTGSSHNTGIATKNGIATVNINHSATLTDYSNASVVTEFTDGNNNWTAANLNSDEDQYALDAHWGAQVVYDYFNAEHSKESYDGNDSAIVSYVHYGTDYTNAAWVSFTNNRGFMIYGDGGGSFTPLTSLDVAAHEIAHGITNNTAQLDYELESGALNEGFSDIWAMVIENHANNNLGTSKDIALINDENGGGTLRSMSNPNAYSLPDTYGGTYWYDVSGCIPDVNTNDYCGVHTNSGVLSYWFWLLSQGGSGTNDIGDVFSVTAIGMDDAAAIAYRMQNTYLTSTSDYADARTYAIQATIDLFGDFCTDQEESVTNAFYAVGVGSEWSANGQSPTITTDIVDQTVCVGIDQVQITAAATDWTNKRWQVYNAGSWDNLSNGGYYANTYSNTMRINNPDVSLNGAQYRVYYENNCGKTHSSVMTLTVFENPVATVDTLTDETCSGNNDGSMTISFDDDSNQTNIEFSIDGGVTYPHNYSDDSGTQNIADLSAATYNVWVRWGDDDCPVELGDYTINTITCIDYTAIPDANFEAKLDQLGYDDISGDGQVPTAAIEVVTNLFVNNSSITDLTGIEAFTALEILNCNTNSITSLDLSSNTNLNNLNCSSNSLTSLDLSANLMLTTLYCSANDISTINVTGNSLLEKLDVIGNLLTSIDVTNNLVLDDLDLSSNSLEAIDLSNNTVITGLSLFGNDILNVDLSNNTLLEFLDLGDNPMSSIDISNNLALLELYTYNSSLTGSLDLSNHTLLTDVDLTNSNFLNLDIRNGNNTNILSFTAIGNSNLTCIQVDDLNNDYSLWIKEANTNFSDTNYCDYTAIPNANFEAKLEALGYDDISADGQVPTALIEVVTSLDIRNSSITDLTGLEDFTALVTLLCRANGISTIDVSQNLLLETLTANNNSIGTIDLSNNTVLKSVNLGGNGLSTLDVSSNTVLESLSLQSSSGLTTIDISNNTLLKSLKTYNSNIATLDISNNTALETLQVYSSPIATIDVTNNPDLIDFRIHNTNVTTLDLSNNPDIEQLRVNDTDIESLDLSNQIALQKLYANDMNLSFLNVQNGNNGNITVFKLTDNPSLSCILVDNAADSTIDWDEVDAGVTFSDTYCRYTAIPDANFEAHLESLGYDDISSDGQVPTALIEVVTSLTAQFEDIVDFTGIEDFIALESLAVSYNSFTDLDVSNNTNLTFLNCGYSLLTNLDVSNNILLETLWVNSTNLSALDLSLNTSLTSLTASAISNLTTLNMQNGNNTNVTHFTTGGNSNLPCVLVDDLVNDYSSWVKDVATSFSDTYCRYTTIPDANFEAALEALGYDDISTDGQVPTALIEEVTSLDVSSSSIANLTGIEGFIALTDLNASDNALISVDVSTNTMLTSLSLHSNSLTSIDVTNNTLLTSLSVSFNELTTIDITNNVLLESFYCNSNDITAIDVSLNTNIKFTNFSDNLFTQLDFSGNSLLSFSSFNNNMLESLNVQNGTNESLVLYISASGNPNLTCVLVDNVDYSTTSWTDIDVQTSYNETSCFVSITPKVFLQGAITNPNTGEESLMRDDLRIADVLPTTSPYTDALTCDITVFDTTGNDAIVDWVWIELRDATDNTTVLASTSALLQRDGDVVAIDGTSAVSIDIAAADYYVVINHRNHLGIRTANTIALSATSTVVNLSTDVTSVTGETLALKDMGDGIYAMYAGDVVSDGSVLNTDITEALSTSGEINVYTNADADMDGNILNTDISILIQLNAGKIQQF